MSLFLATALLCAALLGACWRLARSPVNGPALGLASKVLLVLLPTWLYLRATNTTTPAAATWEACALYVLSALGLVLGYAWALRRKIPATRPPAATQSAGPRRGGRAALLIALGLAYAVFAIHHVAVVALQRPFTRAFYTATRLGYGNYLLTAGAACFVSVLLALVYLQGAARWLACLGGVVTLGALGSKGMPLAAVLMIVYFYYLRRGRVRLGRAAAIAALGAAALYGAFWLYSPGARGRLGAFFIAYSSEARNLVMEIANWHQLSYGALTLSQNRWVLVPRALAPGKPELFGARLLSARYYYQWVMGNTGDPSFGQFGLTWADFGPLAFFIVAAAALVQGALLGELERRLKAEISLPLLVAYLSLAGMLIVSGGNDDLVIIALNIAIGCALGAAMGIRFAQTRRAAASRLYESAGR